MEKGDLQTVTENRLVVLHFSQLGNTYTLFKIQNLSSLCNCINSKQRCSCEHNDDMWWLWGGVQLYAFFTFTLDVAKWLAAYPNYIMSEKKSLICIVKDIGRAPGPVWTFWRRGNLLSLAGNKPLFLSCPAGSPFTTPNELSCVMYNCVCLTGRICYIGTASQSIVEHSLSGQLEPMKMNGAHPGGGGVLRNCSSPPHQILKFKKTQFLYDAIKHLTWFTLQPNPNTEIGWWLIH